MARIQSVIVAPFLILGFAALTGCGKTQDGNSASAIFDSLRSLEASHHEASLQAGTPAAVIDEADRYASSMNDMLDDMAAVCGNEDLGPSMMGSTGMGEMQDLVAAMRRTVWQHRQRMDGMDDLAAMWSECEQHHRDMAGMFQAMHGALFGSGGVSRRGD